MTTNWSDESGTRWFVSIIALVLIAPANAQAPQPLLQYAASLQIENLPGERFARDHLRASERRLAAAEPPTTHCNLALGARRYAELFQNLAMANERLGDYRSANINSEHAVECAPRDASYLALHASHLLALHRYVEARQVVARGQNMAPDDFELRALLLRLNLIEEHWTAVMDLADSLVADDSGDTHWLYWQLLRRVAELRSGRAPDARLPRKLEPDWPSPLWLLLTDKIDQVELVRQLKTAEGEQQLRERLCEALFYQGERLLARGDAAGARLHFAMATRMKILNYVEHDLAQAELTKLRVTADSGAGLAAATHHVFVAR